jgi:E3 ubiquitin-protein ligase BRE1
MGDKRKLYVMEQLQQAAAFPLPKKQLVKAEADDAAAAAGPPPPSTPSAAAPSTPAPACTPHALACSLTPCAAVAASTHSIALNTTVLTKQNQMLSLKLSQLRTVKEAVDEALAQSERAAGHAARVLGMVDGHWRQCHTALALLWARASQDGEPLGALDAADDAAAAGAIGSLIEAAGVPWLEPEAHAHVDATPDGAVHPLTNGAADGGRSDGDPDDDDDAAAALRRLDSALVARASEHQRLFESVAKTLAALAARETPLPPAAHADAALTESILRRLSQPAALAAARARAAASAEQLAGARAQAAQAQRGLLAVQRDAARVEIKLDQLKLELAAARAGAGAARGGGGGDCGGGACGGGGGVHSGGGAAAGANAAAEAAEKALVDARAESDAAKARADSYASETFALRRELQSARAAAEQAQAKVLAPSGAAVRASADFAALDADLAALAAAHGALLARAESESAELRAERGAHRAAREAVGKAAEQSRAALHDALGARALEWDELRKEAAAQRAERESVAAKLEGATSRAAAMGAAKARAEAEAGKAKDDAVKLRASRDELIRRLERAAEAEALARAALARAAPAGAGGAAADTPDEAAARLASAEGARTTLALELESAREEHALLLAEVELISKAYEDGQEALSTLHAHADAKDALCQQLLAERAASAASSAALRDERGALADRLLAADRLAEQRRDALAALDAHAAGLAAELERRTDDLCALSAQAERLRREAGESARAHAAKVTSSDDAVATQERSAAELAQAQAQLLEWRERADRAADEAAEARRKLQRMQERVESGGGGDGMLHEEISLLRSKLKCPLCPRNAKEVCITSCGHTFCRECIDKRLNLRDRKCPTCMRPFATDKVVQIYLTSASQ